jgi:protein required for attachment to host cells
MHAERLKLVVVFNSFNLELYEANHVEIIKALEKPNVHFVKHARGEKHHSHGGAFEPHMSHSEIEHQTASKEIAEYLEVILKDQHQYKELIVIGDPKTLGYFRQNIGHNSKKIMTKSIAKNLAHHDMKQIEHEVFS